MKLQGKILNWNDEKGFGFAEPSGGGDHVFVHIKSFKPLSRRPVNGDAILFEVVRENDNRYKAKNIKFVHDVNASSDRRRATSRTSFGAFFTLFFCIILLGSVFIEKLPAIVIGIYMVMSSVTFVAYLMDKSAAQNGRWRTKESTLHLFSIMGGWPGAYVAQKILRHKSSKEEFKSVYWATVWLNVGGFLWLYTEKGSNVLNSVVIQIING
jgi:uncharacterized membrane protein YsdA (DUF1294 family)/cold shock CspA family protein